MELRAGGDLLSCRAYATGHQEAAHGQSMPAGSCKPNRPLSSTTTATAAVPREDRDHCTIASPGRRSMLPHAINWQAGDGQAVSVATFITWKVKCHEHIQ